VRTLCSAVCCRVLPRVAVCCSQFVAVMHVCICPRSDDLFEREFEVRVKTRCGAVCCCVLQSVAVSLLQNFAAVIHVCIWN